MNAIGKKAAEGGGDLLRWAWPLGAVQSNCIYRPSEELSRAEGESSVICFGIELAQMLMTRNYFKAMNQPISFMHRGKLMVT